MSAASSLPILILAMVHAALPAQAAPAQAPAQPALATPAQAPATQTYHDPALHFTLTYPATLKAEALGDATLGAAQQNATSEVEKQAFRCASMPLTARGSANTSALVIVGLDLDCFKVPVSPAILSPLALDTLTKSFARLGKATLSTPAPYQLDGHDAVFLKALAGDDPTQPTGYGAASCILIEKHVVCLAAISQDRATISSLLTSRLGFDGHPDQPLVPNDLLTR